MNALRRCLGWRAKGAEVDSQSAPYITRLARTESKMDLEIAGISHYNPSHRKVLQNWLQVQSRRFCSPEGSAKAGPRRRQGWNPLAPLVGEPPSMPHGRLRGCTDSG